MSCSDVGNGNYDYDDDDSNNDISFFDRTLATHLPATTTANTTTATTTTTTTITTTLSSELGTRRRRNNNSEIPIDFETFLRECNNNSSSRNGLNKEIYMKRKHQFQLFLLEEEVKKKKLENEMAKVNVDIRKEDLKKNSI